MINQLQVAKDCLERLKTYTDFKGYGLAVDGVKYDPSVDEIYLQESLLSNDNDQGINNNSTQSQLPIYQILINTPKTMSKFPSLGIYSQLLDVFVRHYDISTISGQKLIIDSVDGRRLSSTDTHNVYVVNVNITVLG